MLTMFCVSAGESVPAVVRKMRYLAEAQQRWPFLTTHDATTVESPQQLVTLVRDGLSQPHSAAEKDVLEWIADKDF